MAEIVGTGWVVMRKTWSGRSWFPLVYTFRRTRAEAIRALDDEMGWIGAYERDRRRGTTRAVRVSLLPAEGA